MVQPDPYGQGGMVLSHSAAAAKAEARASVQDYVGKYQLAPGVLFTIEVRGKQLFAQNILFGATCSE